MSPLLQDLRDQASSEASEPHVELIFPDSDLSLEVCCECGVDGEVSGYEIQFIRCSACGQVSYLSPFVSLIPLTDAQTEELQQSRHQVVTTV